MRVMTASSSAIIQHGETVCTKCGGIARSLTVIYSDRTLVIVNCPTCEYQDLLRAD
jgi:hypothetical protein